MLAFGPAAIIGPDIGRRPARDEQIRERRQHVFVLELAGDDQREAFTAGLVDDRQNAELPAIMGTAFDKIISPDMTRIFRAQSDARAVVQPQPAALWLALRDLEPFAPPDPLDPFMVHRPARMAEQGRHPAIAVSTILFCQRDNVFRQRLFVIRPARHLTLR